MTDTYFCELVLLFYNLNFTLKKKKKVVCSKCKSVASNLAVEENVYCNTLDRVCLQRGWCENVSG